MNNKLSRREKILLYILLCFLIVMGGLYLLILPAMTRCNNLKGEYDEALMARAAISQNGGDTSTPLTLGEAKKQAAAATEGYYSPMTVLELNEELTGLMLAYSLNPESLSVTEPAAAAFAGFGETTAAVTGTTAAGGSGTPSIGGSTVLQSQASLRMTGSRDDMIRLIDHIAGYPSLQVTSVYLPNDGTYTMALNVLMFPTE